MIGTRACIGTPRSADARSRDRSDARADLRRPRAALRSHRPGQATGPVTRSDDQPASGRTGSESPLRQGRERSPRRERAQRGATAARPPGPMPQARRRSPTRPRLKLATRARLPGACGVQSRFPELRQARTPARQWPRTGGRQSHPHARDTTVPRARSERRSRLQTTHSRAGSASPCRGLAASTAQQLATRLQGTRRASGNRARGSLPTQLSRQAPAVVGAFQEAGPRSWCSTSILRPDRS